MSSNMDSTVVQCSTNCLLPNDGAMIRCDLCLSWIHKTCAAFEDKDLAEILSKPKKASIPYWHCSRCTAAWNNIIQHDPCNVLIDLNKKVDLLVSNFESEKELLLTIIREKDREIGTLQDLLLEFQSINNKRMKPASHDEVSDVSIIDPVTIHQVISTEGNLVTIHQLVSSEVNPVRDVTGLVDERPKMPIVREAGRSGKQIDSAGKNTARKEAGNIKLKIPSDPEVLVIGSSLLRNVHKYIKSKKVHVAMRPGAKVKSIIDEMMSIPISQKTKSVILHVGGNDVHSSPSNPDFVIGDLWSLVELSKDKFPNARIIVNGTLRRRGVSQTLTKKLNSGIKWMADALRVSYADPNPFVRNADFARDGIHLNDNGTVVFADFLKNSLGLLMNIANG